MRRSVSGLVLVGVLSVLLLAGPGASSAHGWSHRHHRHHHHHHHGGWGPRVIVGVAPPYTWGWGWRGYYGPPPYPYPYPHPVVVREEPEIYVERRSPPAEGYWYYCESAEAYYPRVPSCPEPWVKVPPVPE